MRGAGNGCVWWLMAMAMLELVQEKTLQSES